jgi:protocatechuate 3,4-dioxygenase beta subunit
LRALARALFFAPRAANDIIAENAPRGMHNAERLMSNVSSAMSKSLILLLVLIVLALVLGGVGLGVAYFETKTVQGTMMDSNGAPIARAAVTIAGRSSFSDARGFFEIQFPRGSYELRAFADGYQDATQSINADDFFAQSFSAPLTLQPKQWRARVVDSQNNPIANAQIEINGAALTTNAQGEFSASNVKNGTPIKIRASGYRTVTVTVQTSGDGTQVTTIQLAPSEVRVRVIDATSNKPLPGVRVNANGTNINTDADGVVILTGLTEGTLVSAQAPGYSNAVVKTDGAVQITLKLQPTSLQGRIIDAETQQPVANAILILDDNPIPQQADANGAFQLDDFTQIKRIFVKKPGYALGAFELKQGGAQTFALTPFAVRGIHLFYGIKRADAERVLEQFKNTEMNAVVFDVKEDPGYLLWDSQVPLAKQIGAFLPRNYTAQDEVETCRAYSLYCIARVTVFKDSLLAKNRPDLALHDANGNLLYENSAYWTNPAKKEVQDYHIALAQELAAMGFDEIQFDYIRYPGTRNVDANEFGDVKYRVSTIANFLERTADALRPTRAFFSGDVFGLTTATTDEQGIGQVWENIAPHFDYISPMMYPSTWRYATNLWGAGFGIKNCSDAYACPYEIMRYGVAKAQERTQNHWTLVRPWLQAYQMNLSDMLKQSQGAADAASAGYLFWNNQGIYPNGLFKKNAQ